VALKAQVLRDVSSRPGFFVDGALLTGESYRAKNHARDEGADSPEVAEATNDAFVGSSVINGSV
jgi:hypothetical protein